MFEIFDCGTDCPQTEEHILEHTTYDARLVVPLIVGILDDIRQSTITEGALVEKLQKRWFNNVRRLLDYSYGLIDSIVAAIDADISAGIANAYSLIAMAQGNLVQRQMQERIDSGASAPVSQPLPPGSTFGYGGSLAVTVPFTEEDEGAVARPELLHGAPAPSHPILSETRINVLNQIRYNGLSPYTTDGQIVTQQTPDAIYDNALQLWVIEIPAASPLRQLATERVRQLEQPPRPVAPVAPVQPAPEPQRIVPELLPPPTSIPPAGAPTWVQWAIERLCECIANLARATKPDADLNLEAVRFLLADTNSPWHSNVKRYLQPAGDRVLEATTMNELIGFRETEMPDNADV